MSLSNRINVTYLLTWGFLVKACGRYIEQTRRTIRLGRRESLKLAAAQRRLFLLAPGTGGIPPSFAKVRPDEGRHEHLLAKAQRLRGEAYLADGAIQPWQLTSDGRFRTANDEESWHLLSLNDAGDVCGCARYLAHDNTVPFTQLGVSKVALTQDEPWERKLRWAVEADLLLARKRNYTYVEVGGWALHRELRGSSEAIRIALGAYALARNLGGCIGVTTATTRHSSSSILRRIGGQSLTAGGSELLPYHDPNYRCEMNVLRFDSNLPNPRYEAWIEQIRNQIWIAPVICRTAQGQYRENESLRTLRQVAGRSQSPQGLGSMAGRDASWLENVAGVHQGI